jgi:hypothetical protein
MSKLGMLGMAWVVLGGFASSARAGDCTEDGDCREGQYCEFGQPAVAVPCADDECPQVDASLPPDGYCMWRPIACEKGADCPEGLECDLSSETKCSSADASCDATAVAGRCDYDEVHCETDADCLDRWECLVSTHEVCSASTCAGSGCDGGIEKHCETSEDRICFPKRVDCTTDADCDGDYRCVMFPEDGLDEDSPAQWQGATKVCMPEGLALLFEGKLQRGGVTSAGRTDSDGTGGGSKSATTSSDAESAAASGGDESSDDGCSVTSIGASKRSPAPAWLLLLGFFVWRRSRAS